MNKFPVWQLMDGTVIIQDDGQLKSQLEQGSFSWQEAPGKPSAGLNLWQLARHKIYQVLDRI